MNHIERITALRKLMCERGIAAYIVPSDDFHQSEYVSDYFKTREYISGFTGSAGTVLITQDMAGLWTDGRYFIQAEKQLKKSGMTLFRLAEKGVPAIDEFIENNLQEGAVLGFDGRTVSAEHGLIYEKIMEKLGGGIAYDLDLVGEIWENRPPLPSGKGFHLEECYSGESTENKLSRIRISMQNKNANAHLISSLEEISWIFNMRGSDVAYTPVILAYALIREKDALLFTDEEKLSDAIKANLKANNVKIMKYNDVYMTLETLDANTSLLISRVDINYSLYRKISNEVRKITAQDPAILMKAIKNETEIANIRKAYEMDGVASFRFMHWLKSEFNSASNKNETAPKGGLYEDSANVKITEIDASNKIETLRRQNADFVDDSFASISAYGANAAMMHYTADDFSNAELKSGNLYLLDSGGHYLQGTTDITRTYSLGEIPYELKLHYTLVLKGMIDLSMAVFMHGCRGTNLDILARAPMWEAGVDYRCGTGHGVGYLMSVHEGPARIKWQQNGTNPDSDNAVLEAGMALTNEPGIYIEGSHGIRIENQLIVRLRESTVWGEFLEFETVTLAPIDLDPVLPNLLTDDEKKFLNAYHKKAYEMLSKHLCADELNALKHYTRSI